MKVNEFVEKYRKATDIEKTRLMREIEVKTYVPYAEKVVHSEAVLSKTAKRVHGVLQNNSTLRYLTFITSILKLYTNLELNQEKPHEDYDLLKQFGIVEDIIARIGDDFNEFGTVFNMTWDDMLYNENNWRMFVASVANNFMENVEKNLKDEALRSKFAELGIFN